MKKRRKQNSGVSYRGQESGVAGVQEAKIFDWQQILVESTVSWVELLIPLTWMNDRPDQEGSVPFRDS